MRNDQRNATLDSALRDAEERYVAANPHSRRARRARRPVHAGREHAHGAPLLAVSARLQPRRRGALWDLDGHVYKDFLGEYSAGLYGHSHPIVMAAAQRAIATASSSAGGIPTRSSSRRRSARAFPRSSASASPIPGRKPISWRSRRRGAGTGRDRILGFEGAYHGGVLKFGAASPVNAPFDIVLARYNDTEHALSVIEQHAARSAPSWSSR